MPRHANRRRPARRAAASLVLRRLREAELRRGGHASSAFGRAHDLGASAHAGKTLSTRSSSPAAAAASSPRRRPPCSTSRSGRCSAGLDSTFELLREERGDYPRDSHARHRRPHDARRPRPAAEEVSRRFIRKVCLRLSHDHDKAAEDLIVSGRGRPGPDPRARPRRGRPRRLLPSGPTASTTWPSSPSGIRWPEEPMLRLADLGGSSADRRPRQHLRPPTPRTGPAPRRAARSASRSSPKPTPAPSPSPASAPAWASASSPAALRGILCRDLVTRSLAAHLGQAWIAFLWKRGKHLTATVQTLIRLIRDSPQPRLSHRGSTTRQVKTTTIQADQ